VCISCILRPSVPGVGGDSASIHSSSSGISNFSQCEEVKTGITGDVFVCHVNTDVVGYV
jgi:hypothetical protein